MGYTTRTYKPLSVWLLTSPLETQAYFQTHPRISETRIINCNQTCNTLHIFGLQKKKKKEKKKEKKIGKK